MVPARLICQPIALWCQMTNRGLEADLDNSGTVDIVDFGIFALQWLTTAN